MELKKFNESLKKIPTNNQVYKIIYNHLKDCKNDDDTDEEAIKYSITELVYDFEISERMGYGDHTADNYPWYKMVRKAAKKLKIRINDKMEKLMSYSTYFILR